MPIVVPVSAWCLAIGTLMILSTFRKASKTCHLVSTSPFKSTSLKREGSGRITSAPAAWAAAAIPERWKQRLASLQLTSVTRTLFAPDCRHCRTISATTSGFVFAACSGVRSQPNVWFHQHDVVARDEALHSPKLFHGLSGQLSGIVP